MIKEKINLTLFEKSLLDIDATFADDLATKK